VQLVVYGKTRPHPLVPQRSRVRISQVVFFFGILDYVPDIVVKRFTFAISHLPMGACIGLGIGNRNGE